MGFDMKVTIRTYKNRSRFLMIETDEGTHSFPVRDGETKETCLERVMNDLDDKAGELNDRADMVEAALNHIRDMEAIR